MEATLEKATVFQYKRYSIHDGPGIRTTVFLKGCPLSCIWCHNPEGISPAPQMTFIRSRCIKCGMCTDSCSNSAIEHGDPFRTDRDACVLCGHCADICPTGAREISGAEVTAGEIMSEIEKDIPFYRTSSGGVTFSGGEPLSQAGLLREIIPLCRERGIHTAVDTSCQAPSDVFLEISGMTDLMICDIKLVDDEEMLRYTGVGASGVLKNIRLIANTDNDFIVRMPVVPGITDTWDNLRGVAGFLLSLPVLPVFEPLPYHTSWTDKCRRLGIRPSEDLPQEHGLGLSRVRDFFRNAGIICGAEV